jgi:hypothetical protein
MTDVGAQSNTRDDANGRDELARAGLERLTQFAIRQGYQGLDGALLARIHTMLDKALPLTSTDRAELDDLILELSKITYPVTVANVGEAVEGSCSTRFVYLILMIGLAMAITAGWEIWAISKGTLAEAAGTWLALTLGFVGAVVHVMLPNGRLNLFLGIDAANRANSIVRIIMGGLLGFVLSLVMVPIDKPAVDPKTLLVPLLGGYSITLVVGILAKAISALQLTFNIDSKQVQASLRK